ncbi:MAG TPA: hypothetical protein VNB24_00320 [Acidimicrobiales bacterium]|nr:hypothetical protein [Acidimicrobiales bacterium]
MEPRTAARLGLAVAVSLGLWLTNPAWGPRPPSGDDVMALIVRLDDGMRVLRSGHLDGWSPAFLTGHPQFLHYGPGVAVGALFVSAASFGQLSTSGVLSVLFVVAYAAIAPAMWFLGRSLRLGHAASAVAALLALLVTSPYGVGLAGLYETGLLAHTVAAPFVCVALAATVRAMSHPRRRRWIVAAAACLAVVVTTHVLSALVAPLLAAPLLAVAARRSGVGLRSLSALGVVLLGAAGLSAFWLLPYLAHFPERGDITAWPTPSLIVRLGDIAAGDILFPPGIALIVSCGWVWLVLFGRPRYPLLIGALLASGGLLLFAHALHAAAPSNEIAAQLANRGLGYAGLLAVLPLAALIAFAAERISASQPDLAAVALGALVVVAASGSLRDAPGQQPEAHASLHATAAALRRLVPPHARFATERDFPAEVARLGVRHPDLWLAQRSGRNTLNTFGVELSPTPKARFLTEFLSRPSARVRPDAGTFARHGVTHVVTLVPATTTRLVGQGGFRRVAQHGSLTILEVDSPAGQPPPASLVSLETTTGTAQLTKWRDRGESLTLRVRADKGTTASLAVGWSSRWRATLDGAGVPVLRRPDRLVGIAVPAGAHTVTLRFRQDPLAYVGAAISIGTVVAGVVLLGRRRRSLDRLWTETGALRRFPSKNATNQ